MAGAEHISWLRNLEQEVAEWALQGLWEHDSRNDLIRWSGDTGKLLGLEETENPVTLERFLQCVASEFRTEVRQVIQSGEENRRSRQISFRSSSGATLANGGLLEAIWKTSPAPEPPGTFKYGVLRLCGDSERRGPLEEIKKSVLHDVGSFFTTDSTLVATLQDVLAYLNEFGHFSASELWLSHQNSHRLVAHHTREPHGRRFYEISGDEISFPHGTGLPGHVARNDDVTVWDNLGTNQWFLRNEAAREAGLKCGTGIPLNAAGLTGALVFLDHKRVRPAYEERQVYQALREFLAREILRKQKEEEMRFLFEGAPDLMAVAGTAVRFEKVNPAFSRTLGFSADELTSRPFTEFLHPDDRNRTQEEYAETITGERRARGFINRYLTRDGDYRWISWTSSAVFGLDGHVFAYGRDISQRIDYMHKLEEQNGRLREIAWIQSHVVRAPLARLIGLIELLKMEANSDQQRRWVLQSIAKSAQELDSIIGEIIEKSQQVENNDGYSNR